MHRDHDIFLQATKNGKKLRLFFRDNYGHSEARLLVPLDYNPGRRSVDKASCYHFWDFEIGANGTPLMFFCEQIDKMCLTEEKFDPNDFVDIAQNTPKVWRRFFVKRDWGFILDGAEEEQTTPDKHFKDN